MSPSSPVTAAVASKRAWINAELEAGESVLYFAEPHPRSFSGAHQIGVFLFAVVWTAFAVFWTAIAFTATSTGGGSNFCLVMFGLPFVAVGVLMLFEPVRNRRRLGATVYCITDRRVLIIEPSGTGSRRVRSFLPGQLSSPERVDHADGSSDLIFAQTVRSGHRGGSYTTPEGFFGVRDGRDAEGYLRMLIESEPRPGSVSVPEPLSRVPRRHERRAKQ